MILDVLDATQVVVNGYRPPISASAAQLAHHKHIATESLLLLIQVVSQQIMLQIGRHWSAHKIWLYLRKSYYKDNPLAFVYKIHAFNSFSSTLDTSQSITDFINTFEIRWMRLQTLTSNARPGSFKAVYRTLLELEEAKSHSLPQRSRQSDDQENLSYDDLKERLVGLAITTSFRAIMAGITPMVEITATRHFYIVSYLALLVWLAQASRRLVPEALQADHANNFTIL
ncbi:hypothetical protein L211DRAFT_475088 [Terfezia boudieri ATCC MYA-4762]|uniref:Uncharacterized protein n=1 Tax=Terfezia boudieri ATCC MYA-4762 TaxID=1051890 RepID=A0A3N4M522_9PEZI|nr:hypothetical protein L211DRAFT_475088 [Terfezia boudieri ATCC MYA-4762]